MPFEQTSPFLVSNNVSFRTFIFSNISNVNECSNDNSISLPNGSVKITFNDEKFSNGFSSNINSYDDLFIIVLFKGI